MYLEFPKDTQTLRGVLKDTQTLRVVLHDRFHKRQQNTKIYQ